MTVSDPQWDVIDPWWERISRDQEQDLIELRDVLEALDATWTTSQCLFDQDPLGADWKTDGPRVGPLRVNQEENWSQWLAHLIQSSPERFVRESFGTELSDPPRRVRCEVPLNSDADHDRRADIVIEFPDQGISIEVKIDDEHYTKTPETAHLLERIDTGLDWSHYLLVPKYKHAQLRATVGDRYQESDGKRPTLLGLRSDEPGVDIVYWRDVSRALRRMLLGGSSAGPHWQASAYLFITLIERRLCRFFSEATVTERMRSRTLGVSDVTHLQSSNPVKQCEYLTEFLTHIDD